MSDGDPSPASGDRSPTRGDESHASGDQFITVGSLFEENQTRLKLELLTGDKGFAKKISERDLHRPGLALAGFTDLFTFNRVQVCGNTEATYLRKLDSSELDKCVRKMFQFDIPCIIDTSEDGLPAQVAKLADAKDICVFRTPFATTKLFQLLGDYLDAKFAPTIYMHGTLVDVYGIGILITGQAGIGKSEVALDLVARGHRLVADDMVHISRRTGGVLIGSVNETLRFHMEIRGLGIIDIHAMFGIRGIRPEKKIEVQVELVPWSANQQVERLGLADLSTEILSEKLPLVRLPIYPGKNISMIVETIALNQLLRNYGYNAAQEFDDYLNRQIGAKLTQKEEFHSHKFE